MAIHKIELLVDDADFRDITKELAFRGDRMLPDSEDGANDAGRMVAEIVRDIWEYRVLSERNRKEGQQS